MSKTIEGKVLDKFGYYCPNCDNPKELEVIDRAFGEQDIEICGVCNFPEGRGRIRIERVKK